ncbi:MAG: HAMP domain-containing protein [Xanthomonadales bacterium]|nr:HAMP domain-containing protein [Gammaproteobacteria bacterium]NNE06114.1 HAMP domain-containing protein [Xanthomonadales bacterium]NNL94805.1 HAMP domain-containing protein [Xanthomonadales bacterium]
MSRLFWKLFLALWLSIMGFAVIMAMVNNYLSRPEVFQEQNDRVGREIEALSNRLTAALNRQGEQGARRLMRQLPRRFSSQIFLFNEQGQEVAGRENAAQRLQAAGVQQVSRELVTQRGQRYRLVVARRPTPPPVLEPGQRGVMIRLLIAAFVSGLVSFLLARHLASPLSQLGAASRSLAGGDLSTRIGLPLTKRKDEFGGLALDFDRMAVRLEELQTANRRLLRDVSHELRSPLARLSVALEIARNRDCEPVQGELDRIALEAERLESLINEVLDLLRETSETRPLHTERFSIRELLADLQGIVSYEAPESSPGIVLHDGQDVEISANRELVWRALENLVRNALIHSDPASGVEISLASEAGDPTAVIKVSDRGPGLAEQHLEKIFEPFYRAQEARDRKSGGHGLGLAIAAAAIRRHGGTLTALNREGGGLEMVVKLPLS